MMKKLISIFLNLFFFSLILSGCQKDSSADIGEMAPEISATTINGKKMRIHQQNDVNKNNGVVGSSGKNIPIKPSTKAINPTNKYIAFFNFLILLSS